MASPRRFEIPELFPQPKQIMLTEGDSELSIDIRLVTSNVLPIQRKAIRSILTSAGVKVVANKKRYVVEAKVNPPETFELGDVPENGRHEYYEIKIQGTEIFITAPYQEGTVAASQTLAGIFKRFLRGLPIPNLVIRDWPILPVRGIFIENKWGTDRMTMVDWCQAIDAIAGCKLNTLGIGLYGCWGNCRFEGDNRPAEFLMAPVTGNENLVAPHTFRWYSDTIDGWKEETYNAFLAENNMLSEVITYGRERGVTIVPFVNSLGHNTFFPRMIPKISAKDADGKPTGNGYCLSSPDLKQFIEQFYGGILDKYFQTGCEYFHVQLDEILPDHAAPADPLKVVSPWCQCPKCRAKDHAELLKDYIIWLVQTLVAKKVDKVILWNDMLTREMQLLDGDFIQKLEAAGLKDHLIIDWWNYSNTAIDDTCHPAIGQKLGLKGIVSPMACYYNWSTYNYNLPNIDLMLKMAENEHAHGTIAYSVHDPSHLDHDALLGALAWESSKGVKRDSVIKRWATAYFSGNAAKYLKATSLIRDIAVNPVYETSLYYQYTYVNDKWPREYPGEALDRLLAREDAGTLPEQFRSFADNASAAIEILNALVAQENIEATEMDCFKSLRGEAYRILFNAKAFAFLVSLRQGLVSGTVKKSYGPACQDLYNELLPILAAVEKNLPTWLVPAALSALSVLLEYIRQLAEQLNAFANRKKANAIAWTRL